jgi:hypothetical protein
LTSADKGKSVVIIENTKFQEKIMNFNLDNDLVKLDKDHTLKYQREVKDIIKNVIVLLTKLYSTNLFK